MIVGFDTYRDDESRKLMIEFVMARHAMDANRAVAQLRALNHVGLAYLYRDALARAGSGNLVDYDPCEVRR